MKKDVKVEGAIKDPVKILPKGAGKQNKKPKKK